MELITVYLDGMGLLINEETASFFNLKNGQRIDKKLQMDILEYNLKVTLKKGLLEILKTNPPEA